MGGIGRRWEEKKEDGRDRKEMGGIGRRWEG